MPSNASTALVVGAGISGVRVALDLVESGYGAILVDRAAHMGGLLCQLDAQFPTNGCGMCRMLPLLDRDRSLQTCLRRGLFHEDIEILLATEILALEGQPGSFRVTLHQQGNWVDPRRCIGCGACIPLCPVEIPDAFNQGLSARKAIYRPVPHAAEAPLAIDTQACTRCGACQAVCPTGAIRLAAPVERQRFRILVVDDEQVVRESLQALLAEEGYTVLLADSGQHALEVLADHAPHLMLTDIKMPGMDGVELLQRARAQSPDLTVVMMTAYATLETAIDAMKRGALDYLVKPFDTDTLLAMVQRVYELAARAMAPRLEVGAVVLSSGVAFYDPRQGVNNVAYGQLPDVLTQIEFERWLSAAGPTGGSLRRPSDGAAVRRIAWLQCVGSRDLQADADFCSTVCCMISLKQAVLARQRADGAMEAVVYAMDLRTPGKHYQRYADQAQKLHGVQVRRGRVHSVVGGAAGGVRLQILGEGGQVRAEGFDLAVLALGQRPAAGGAPLAERTGVPLNPWGFLQEEPLAPSRTARDGVLLAGSATTLHDIAESVTLASCAALNAARVLHTAGAAQPAACDSDGAGRCDPPRILAVLCTCHAALPQETLHAELDRHLRSDPALIGVRAVEGLCGERDLEALSALVTAEAPNRVLIGACRNALLARDLRRWGREHAFGPGLLELVDIRCTAEPRTPGQDSTPPAVCGGHLRYVLEAAVARLRRAEPTPAVSVAVTRQALVVGGGIAGMSAALAMADLGVVVHLVEREQRLGGNLRWLNQTLSGETFEPLLERTLARVTQHPHIHLHLHCQVTASRGEVGHFATTVCDAAGHAETLAHGVVILASGGGQAATGEYGYGHSPAVVTQQELEIRLRDKALANGGPQCAVMILCVGSRQEPRDFCSRICCPTALKHALALRRHYPDGQVYVLYRDLMSTGFSESYYTQARREGVTFIRYTLQDKPVVRPVGDGLTVELNDPILERRLQIEADMLVLATGVASGVPQPLAAAFGATRDPNGFFQEADPKWRPVDSLAEGVFACGLALSPRNVPEAIASAEAAALRAMRILARERMPAGKQVAGVHASRCSLCERCITACPYGARQLNADRDRLLVNPVKCQGCGTCSAICPNGAAFIEGGMDQAMLATIDAALAVAPR